MATPTRVMGVKPIYTSTSETEGQDMAEDTIWVMIEGDRGSFWERNPVHPNGEVSVRGGGPAVEVARTQKVQQALAGHLKQVDTPKTDEIAEVVANAATDDAIDEPKTKDLASDPARKPIATNEQPATAAERKEAATPRRRGRPPGSTTKKSE